jgi:hypothetical protein
MTLTSVDIPEDLMDFMDSLIQKGVRKNRKDIFVEALRYYSRFSMYEWNPPQYYIHAHTRVAWVTDQSIRELLRILEPQKHLVFGNAVGRNIRDICMIAEGIDTTKKENWKRSLEFLEFLGHGRFKISEDKINATDSFLSAQVLQGCIEALFDRKLKLITSSLGMALFQIS